jgi:hypothetical protein
LIGEIVSTVNPGELNLSKQNLQRVGSRKRI